MKVKLLLMLGVIAYSFSVNAQNKEIRCEQFYEDAKSAYDKEDYEVALIFFNRCKTESCTNADFQIYIDVCNMKLGKKSNVAIIDNGVEINGVVWATCNVGSSGTFVPNPGNYGGFYTWKDAQNVCPAGWRLPTDAELQSLINAGSVWTTQDNVRGKLFGNNGNTVFLPVAGNIGSFGQPIGRGLYGCYWSSTKRGKRMGIYYLNFTSTYAKLYTDSQDGRFSVRCVAE